MHERPTDVLTDSYPEEEYFYDLQRVTCGATDERLARIVIGESPEANRWMRAHGVRELSAHLRGEFTLETATRLVELATGQYTKRQATWFRHHPLASPGHAHMIRARSSDVGEFLERNYRGALAFIENLG